MLGCSLDGKILRSHLKRQRVNSAHSSVDKETRRTPLRDNEGQLWLKKLKTFNENQWFCLDTNICGKDFFSFKERKGQKKLAELAHLWISIRHDMSTTADVLSWPETDPCSCVFTGKPLYQICEMCHFNWSKKKKASRQVRFSELCNIFIAQNRFPLTRGKDADCWTLHFVRCCMNAKLVTRI